MSLADHYDGGSWLQEGWHDVSIKGYNVFQYNSGSDGVQFKLTDTGGRTGKVSFCLVETILWRLAEFAKACGLTKDEAARYEPSSANSHHVLVGRHLQVRLEKQEKYHEVVEWVATGENITNTPADPRADRSGGGVKRYAPTAINEEVAEISAEELKRVPF